MHTISPNIYIQVTYNACGIFKWSHRILSGEMDGKRAQQSLHVLYIPLV